MKPAVGLFFLSPLVAEFLLGNLPITWLHAVFFLAPLYGAGALLIREITRRTGRGWPTIMLLGVAYALIEEGLVTQLLFNRDYYDLGLLEDGYIPALGMGAVVTVFVTVLHTVWSICVPIAIVETFTPDRRTTPWLGRFGLGVVAVIFLAGVVLFWRDAYSRDHFIASAPQIAGMSIVILALVVAAFLVRDARVAEGNAPRPVVLGLVALGAASLFLAPLPVPAWASVTIALLLTATMATLVWRWSRHPDWRAEHRFALVCGAVLSYAWYGFVEVPIEASSATVDAIGNAIFATAAIILLLIAGRTVQLQKGL